MVADHISHRILQLSRRGQGMEKISDVAVEGFADARMSWLHEPTSWNVVDATGATPGSGGKAELHPHRLVLAPPAYKDFWARTYYTPLLIKHDASAFVLDVSSASEVTATLSFEYTPQLQFDQAGLLIYIDNDHWVKCGIEYCDGSARLSVVVCNVYSDWSTQPWPSCSATIRVHKILNSSSIVVEAAPLNTTKFDFIRIAHLSAMHGTTSATSMSDTDVMWRIGPFAACPGPQKGNVATFTRFVVEPRVASVHDQDVSNMTS